MSATPIGSNPVSIPTSTVSADRRVSNIEGDYLGEGSIFTGDGKEVVTFKVQNMNRMLDDDRLEVMMFYDRPIPRGKDLMVKNDFFTITMEPWARNQGDAFIVSDGAGAPIGSVGRGIHNAYIHTRPLPDGSFLQATITKLPDGGVQVTRTKNRVTPDPSGGLPKHTIELFTEERYWPRESAPERLRK